jgi:alanyl-tRNA synthetase
MKQKLYYQDVYLQTFTAHVKGQEQDAQGNWYVTLDQTAFYPTGGGQPFDIGKLDEVNVMNVEEVNGEIRHYIDQPLFAIKMEVTGQIDWNRRFDFMQQHAGQHILTAAFVELFGIQNTSFHLGKEMVSIDLNFVELSEQQLMDVENLANQIILENRRIETKYITKQELVQYPLRKDVTVNENIRLVIIPDFDYNGCGGTHPHSTGEVGSLKVLHTEKQKGNVRVHFVCGGRVISQLQRKQKTLLDITRLLSAPEEGLNDAIRTLLNHEKKLEKSLAETKELLFEYETKELVASKEKVNGVSVIQISYQNRSIQELQKLARMVVLEAQDAVVLIVSENVQLLQFVAARGANVQLSMKHFAAKALPIINGKGGGSESFVQGGGETVMTAETFIENIKQFITD